MAAHSPEPRPCAPWWLRGGTELCPHCGQRYHLEAERRCTACDAPGCWHCVEDGEGLCPACTQGARE